MTARRRPEAVFPAVTVIVPTRCRRDLVRRTVGSIVCQDYPGAIRCLVVHDQEEPDESLRGLGAPHRVVHVVRNEGQPGLAAARNAGLRLADTDILASCDDDDTWLPDKLRRQVERLQTQHDLLVVGAGINLMLPEGRVVPWCGSAEVVTHADLLRSRRKELHSSTLVMRREAFELAGPYDEGLPQSYAEDYEWLLRVSRFGPVGVVTRPLANVHKDGVSWFRSRNEVVADALEYLLDRHPDLRSTRRGHARILGQIAFARASLGQRRASARWIARSLGRWPLAPQAGIALAQVLLPVDPRVVLRGARLFGRGLS